MTTTVCQVHVSQTQADEIRQCEAVVVRTYERKDGSTFAVPVRWGEREEMEIVADTPRILLGRRGQTCLGDSVVLVSDLLPPEE